MSSIIDTCHDNASEVTKCIRQVKKTDKIDLNIWSFDKACMSLCSRIRWCLNQLNEAYRFEIVYVKLCEEEQNKKVVMVNGFSNEEMQAPSIFGKKRIVPKKTQTAKVYYDLSLFASGNSAHQIIWGKDNVDRKFNYEDDIKRLNNKDRYDLYIGIPVICDNMKMVGLLEVTCSNRLWLGQSQDEADESVRKFLVPYANVFLLLYKMEKALLAGTDNIKEKAG